MKRNIITTKGIFIILGSLWIIDFILTFIALNFFGFYELNPVARFFYEKGIYGFSIFFIMVISFIYLQSFLIYKCSFNKYNKKPLLTLCAGIFVFLAIEVLTILSNIYWLKGGI